MKEYVCVRCDYTTSSKFNYRTHLLRKVPCTPTKEDVSQASLLIALDGVVTERPTKFTCPHCEKDYATRTSLHTHKGICKLKVTGQLHEIHIRNFGDESIDHITNDVLSHCLLNRNHGVETLLKAIYFNKDIPQNQTVLIKSLKNKTVTTYQDGRWIVSDERNTLHAMIHKSYKLLYNYYDFVKDGMDGEESDGLYKYFMGLLGQDNAYFELRRNIRTFVHNFTK